MVTDYAERILGHLSRSPSSQRIYSNSAIGDLRGVCSSATGAMAGPADVDGSPLISSSSVTISPLFVISLRRMMRLWGKSPRDVLMCWRTCWLLSCQGLS